MEPDRASPDLVAQRERTLDQLAQWGGPLLEQDLRIGASATRPGLTLRRLVLLVAAAALLVLVPVAVAAYAIGGPVLLGFVVVGLVIPAVAVLKFVGSVPGFLRRVLAVHGTAKGIGWTFVGQDDSLARRWRGDPFAGVSASRTSEVLRGPWAGKACVSFVYHRVASTTDGESSRPFHVVAVALPAWLPTLELTAEGVGDRVAKALGAPDLEVESADFNREWRVRTDDVRFAHAVLHPRLMARLLEQDARGLSMRIEGSDLISWVPGDQDLTALATRLQVLSAVADSVPDFVWRQYGRAPAAPSG